MTRARTGSHSRTEPGAVHAYEVVDHGVEHEQYFQGCGVAHTQWDDVAVGAGNSPLEAYEDAVEVLAGGGWNVDTLPQRPRGLSSQCGFQADLDNVDVDAGDEVALQHYICVYVRGIPTRRTRMAQQFRRAGTVGPGRPGQQFTHGDVEIETTLHPIDLDGGYSVEDDPRREAWVDEQLERYELVYSTGGHGGPHRGIEAAKAYAENLMRGGREHWIAVVPYGEPYDYDHHVWVIDDEGWMQAPPRLRHGLGGVSPRTRLGTRVQFAPNPASRMLYSERYGLPEVGEEGTVTYMPGFKPKTYMPGPGGGLLYVEWDQAGVLGVSPNDVVKAGAADPYQEYRSRGLGGADDDDDDAAEAPTFDWPNAEYFGAYLEGDEDVGTGAYVAAAKFKGSWWAMVDTQEPDGHEGPLLRKGGFKTEHAAYAAATKRAEQWVAATQDAAGLHR